MCLCACFWTGNIRIYCRIRPFLPGQPTSVSAAEAVDEQTLSILTPVKNGKGKKLFTFNRVFGPSASQGESFCLFLPQLPFQRFS